MATDATDPTSTNPITPIDLLREGDFDEFKAKRRGSDRAVYHGSFFSLVRTQLIYQHDRIAKLEQDMLAQTRDLRDRLYEQSSENTRLRRRVTALEILLKRQGKEQGKGRTHA